MEIFSRQNIEKMLDYVDCKTDHSGGSKRRDAYVTEFFFEQKILPAICNGKTSTGWCYVEKGFKRTRHWFKVFDHETKDEIAFSIDRKIIESIFERDNSSQFFSIYIDNRQKIMLRRIVFTGGSFVQRKIDNSQKYCDVNAMNDEVISLNNCDAHPVPFVARWLEKADDAFLKKLLLQRLLLNVGLGSKWPRDVDAIELIDSGIIFHEFKRKTPCPNGCFVLKNSTLSAEYLRKILQSCRAANIFHNGELSRYLEENFKAVRDENIDCFGLDLSHFGNFQYCLENGINYNHIIWDSSNYPNKPNVEQLFTDNCSPKNQIKLLSKFLDMKDYVGFIMNHGDNAGTFHSNLRLQVALLAREFEHIEFKSSDWMMDSSQ
jgi:hypothetical protein